MSIKLIVFEPDGTLNSGKSSIVEGGITMSKEYFLADFYSLSYLKKSIIIVGLSCDRDINGSLFKSKNIPFFYSPPKEKFTTLCKEILPRYQVTLDEILYICGNITDKECFKYVPKTLIYKDHQLLFGKALYKTFSSKPGEGVFAEVFLRLQEFQDA